MAFKYQILALENENEEIDVPLLDDADLQEDLAISEEEFHLVNRSLESIEITLGLCRTLRAKPNLSVEDVNLVKESLALSTAGLPYQPFKMTAAMEAQSTPLEMSLPSKVPLSTVSSRLVPI